MQKIINKVLKILRPGYKLVQMPNKVILSYNKYGPKVKPKRALLSYLVGPVEDKLNGQHTVRFSNAGIATTWPRVLNELGYIVDIVNWDDTDFKPQVDHYDLVVMHGGVNYKAIKGILKPNVKAVYFSTGSYWKFHNNSQNDRLKALAKRRSIEVKPERLIEADEASVYNTHPFIVAIGNKDILNTFPKDQKVATLNNATYPDDRVITRNYRQARKNFLFFAGGGNVHKGLDLVVETFAGLPYSLYIFSPLEKEFCQIYKKELALKNIHPIGQVEMRSKAYYEVVQKCGYTIMPSCSEGQPGAVIEAMLHGLVPIVSKESHLDVGDCGYILSNNNPSTIRQTVKTCANIKPNEIADMSSRASRKAQTDYNPDVFYNNLKRILGKIA